MLEAERDILRVLLVDESSIVRERLKAFLSEVPKVEIVGQAENEPDALDLIERLNPEVVVLDIQLCDRSGIDLLQKIKKEKRPPLVAILTNLSDPQYRKKCLDVGADFFFDKSSEFEKVAEVIKKASNPGRGRRVTGEY
jgi:DNA-binding NarL/FixJ family response regulator